MFSEWWFSPVCILAAGWLAAFTVKEYRLIAKIVFLEFLLHGIIYYFGVIQTDILHSALLYVAYMIIQVVALYFIFKLQTHVVIATLIFLNSLFNFVMVIAYINLATVDTYNNYVVEFVKYRAAEATWIDMVGSIMIFELIYLLGINTYVAGYVRRNGPIKRDDIDYLDRLFSVRRNIIREGVV